MTQESDVKYATRSVKTVRGMEARTRAKLEKEGWEFVSQSQGRMRSELTFRKPAPKTPWLLLGIIGGVLVVLFGIIIVMNVVTGSGNEPQETAPTPTQSTAIPATTPSASPADAVTPMATPEPAAAPMTDTTVDALLDQLNSQGMGGIQNGDRFRFTGELFMSDLWATGAAGEYTVLLKAYGGAQDLFVFVDESEAAAWTDGTQVEMVVEAGPATINGETTDGWLRVVSATTLP